MASLGWWIASAISTVIEEAVEWELSALKSRGAFTDSEQDPDFPGETSIESSGAPPPPLDQPTPVGYEPRQETVEDAPDMVPLTSENGLTERYCAKVHVSVAEDSSPPSETGASSQSTRTGQSGVQLFCGSTNTSVGTVAYTNVGRDMVVQGIDPMEFERVQAAMWAEVRSALASLPPGMGFSSANGLVLTDALDETITLPWSIVPTYDDLHRLLVKHFSDKVGEQCVSEGRYCIARAEGASGGKIVSRNRWRGIVGGHERLVMSVLIQQVVSIFRMADLETKEACPKCGKTKLGTYKDQGWNVCLRCNTRFLLSSEPEYRIEEVNKTEDNEEIHFRHIRKTETFPGGMAQQDMMIGIDMMIRADPDPQRRRRELLEHNARQYEAVQHQLSGSSRFRELDSDLDLDDQFFDSDGENWDEHE